MPFPSFMEKVEQMKRQQAEEEARKQALGNRAQGFEQQSQGLFRALGQEGHQARQMLMDQATGKSSISAEQLRQGNQQNMAQQQALAAGAAPSNAVMAARTAQNNAAQLGAGLAGKQAMAGIAERNAAQNNLMNSILAQRGQELQARGQGVNTQMGLLNMDQQKDIAQMGQPTDAERMMGFGSSMLSFLSDRTKKKDVRKVGKSLDSMLDRLKPTTYRYKDERYGEGRRAGIMAQDLEASDVGRRVIRETPHGKAVDVNAGLSAALASAARLNERVRDLEKRAK